MKVSLWPILLITMAAPTLSVPLLQFEESQHVLALPKSNPRASLPATNPTRSFWIDTPDANPLGSEGSTGALTQDADVCIIGSGITGISAAYHLLNNSSLNVVVLEARDFCSFLRFPSSGAYCDCYRLWSYSASASGYGKEEAVKSLQLENHTAEAIVKIIHQEGLADAVDLVRGGHTTLFLTEKEREEAWRDYTEARAAGLELNDVKWTSMEDMQTPYNSTGIILRPLKFVTHLYRIAKQRLSDGNLTLHTRTPVTSVSSASNSTRRWEVNTPRGSISCSYVVHATNGYASHLLPHLAGPEGIVPTRGQIIALRSSAKLAPGSWDGNEGFEYWFPRPRGEGLVILGGGREASGPSFEYYETDDGSVNADVGRALRGFLGGVFEGDNEEPEMEWTGIMGFTKMGDPFVGPVIDSSNPKGYEGQYISAGYTGHGMPRAYACAEAISTMILTDMSKKEWTRPEWLPKRYLTSSRV
ncbi:FAD dependent oxidoreductase-domain-containing protein [Desarmillaria tabescens]|uniref:FAD dependent oxidoreductase-domain-containing protein n=1 Tax=Armillaria tabescens TaxID=1929756 RepID=A0AA39NE33_ARMTA|nr:FAD dependent oxidoreductase-domain-containing protein [Desarmillaria tabescens]KAK0463925.1 FAD dependent oxidoreductase-domain-containing protein [Desarmillaria tabescens]